MPTLNIETLREQRTAARNRAAELAATVERENRELTEAEQVEARSLAARIDTLTLRIQAAEAAEAAEPQTPARRSLTADVRSAISGSHVARGQFVESRAMMTTDVSGSGLVPLTVAEVQGPLYEGLIYHQLGLPVYEGVAGDFIFPTYDFGEATELDEGEEMTESKITLNKKQPTPQRIGWCIPATRESIDQTNGTVETIIRSALPRGLARRINKYLLSPTKVSAKTNIVGPFVECDRYALPANPTYQDFCLMKATVLATGIEANAMCWVMTKAEKAILESTPRDAGSGIMIVENDQLCGLPIYTSQWIGERNIGLGDWSYQPLARYGLLYLTVDQLTKARRNIVDFILNSDYGSITLYKEAFLLGQIAEPEPEPEPDPEA